MGVAVGNIATSANIDSAPLNTIFTNYANEINRVEAYLPTGTAAGRATAAATANTVPIRDANGAITLGGQSIVVSGVAVGGLGITGIAGQSAAYLNVVASTSGNNGAGGTVFSVLADKSTNVQNLIATAPNHTTLAGIFKRASGSPTTLIPVFGVYDNAGTGVLFTVDELGSGIFAGNLAATGTGAFGGSATVGGTLGVTGALTAAGTTVTTLHATGAVTHDGTVANTGDTTFGGSLIGTGIAAPAFSTPGSSRIYTDTSGAVHVSQNGAAYQLLLAAANASGSAGAVQVAAAGNAFTDDGANFFYDKTNHFLGLGTAVPATRLDMLGVMQFRGGTGGVASGPSNGRLYYDTVAQGLIASYNGDLYSTLARYTTNGAQVFSSVSGGFQFTPAGGQTFSVLGPLTQGAQGATNYGAITSQGSGSGLAFWDRAGGSNASVWYRTGTTSRFNTTDSGGADLLTIDNTTGTLTTNAVSISPAMTAASSATALSMTPTFTTQNSEALIGAAFNGVLTLASTTPTSVYAMSVEQWTGTATAATLAVFTGLRIKAQSPISGLTVTDCYGIFAATPAMGTNNTTAYFTGQSAQAGTVGIGTMANNRPLGTLHVGQVAAGVTSLLVTALTGATADLVKFDATAVAANAQVTHIDKNGHLAFSSGAAPVASGLLANITSVTFAGNDQTGKVTIVVGGAIAASSTVSTNTFATAFNVAPPQVSLIPANSATWALAGTAQFSAGTIAVGTFLIVSGTTAPATATYVYTYVIA